MPKGWRKEPIDVECIQCHKPFTSHMHQEKICSDECKLLRARTKQREWHHKHDQLTEVKERRRVQRQRSPKHKERIGRLKAEGRCPIHHNEPAVEGKIRCKKCSDSSKVRYKQLKAIRMCPGHPGEPAVEGHNLCQKCLDKEKVRRQRLKAEGMCPRCLSEPVLEGHTMCQRCILTHRIAGYKRRGVWGLSDEEAIAKMREPCWYCGKEAPPKGHGLDKVDPEGGYTDDNTVPCCSNLKATKSNGRGCNELKNACTIKTAQKMIEHQLEIYDESTVAWIRVVTNKLPNPTFIPQPTHAQSSLDGGHF